MSAGEEADDVGVFEPGDDLHFAFELLGSARVRLGAGEHEFHGHRITAGVRGGEIDGAATAADEFAGEGVVAEKTGGKMPLRRPAAETPQPLAEWGKGGIRQPGYKRFSFRPSFTNLLKSLSSVTSSTAWPMARAPR
jgi:hypothetical protein